MASERKWLAVTQLFTANGTILGVIKVPTSRRFKVKARVILQSNTQEQRAFEIKSVPDCFTIEVGPCGNDIDARSDVSMYTLADAAWVVQPKQKRPPIGPGEIDRAVYEEEPTVARRVFPVDDCGQGYTKEHPFPTEISDGNDQLEINPDGSINVVVTNSSPYSPLYGNSGNVDVNSDNFEEIFSYTSTDSTTRIFNIESTCSTPALFRVKFDGAVVRELRSSSLERNVKFEFRDGRILLSGKKITVEAQVDRFLLTKYIAFTSFEGGKA